MKLWRRAPREFRVTIGSPWTINGKPTNHSTPQAALQEIYDTAVYFPIRISVTGNGISYSLEMDEEMRTRSLDQVTHEISSESNEGEGDGTPALEDNEAPTSVSAEKVDAEQNGPKLSGLLDLAPRTLLIAAGAVVALAAAGLVATQVWDGSADNANASESNFAWESTVPSGVKATKSLDSKFTMKLWALEPGEADYVSWFGAGIVATDEEKGEITLYSQTNGRALATHKIGDGASLPKDLRWAAEFTHDGEPAVGLRIAETFVGINSTGQTQEWKIPSNMEVKVHGTTPLMTNATSEDDPNKVTYKALIIGEKDPIDLTVNKGLATRAVDGNWLVQMDLKKPVVAMNPTDRTSRATGAHAVTLTAPTDEASFVRHLDAGHEKALALWRVQEQLYVGVHPLTGDTPGAAVSFVKAPFVEGEAKNWTVAAGMKLALLGPYAFSLETGELVEESATGDFTRAYGPAAVTIDGNDRRTLILEHTEYTETQRIIGFSGQGTILVRLLDGSVAAYGESGGLL